MKDGINLLKCSGSGGKTGLSGGRVESGGVLRISKISTSSSSQGCLGGMLYG